MTHVVLAERKWCRPLCNAFVLELQRVALCSAWPSVESTSSISPNFSCGCEESYGNTNIEFVVS